MKPDKITRKWIRNAADERAAENGCRFDPERANHVCEFFSRYLRLYEGDKAREPFNLMDWQRDVLSRVFGWVRKSEFRGRDIRRFTKSSIFVPKKNGKSPMAAGVGLYLLIADGEQGQKVFSAARDGKQAAIIHTHARKMVESSPELSSVCKINQSTGRITHLPSTSFYDILSGDNILGQEGLNGSVVIDETHVVDSRLAAVIEYMGASRAEPLQFEVSTAGNDPLGYGHQQYEYGRNVNQGIFPDDAFFFETFEAPADASDAELGKPKVWKAANPSWGLILDGTKFQEDFSRSKRSLKDWTDFKMYRLNIWANSANPFIKADDWKACREEFDESTLIGVPCVASLDLARKKDMTSMALVFAPDENGIIRFLIRYWMPEQRALELEKEVPYLQWSREGFVTLTDGDVCDYRVVEKECGELFQKYSPNKIIFDPTFAEEMTQRLAEDFNLERIEFPQNSIKTWAKPTKDFEDLIIARKLHHEGNPILSWQIGHVLVKEASGMMRPVRPNRGDARTIDGVVATIMGIAAVVDAPQQYIFHPGSLAL